MPSSELTLIFPDNPLLYCEPVKFCLLPLLCLWTADGPIPMRFMGGTKNISGGRCYMEYPIPPHPPHNIALRCTLADARAEWEGAGHIVANMAKLRWQRKSRCSLRNNCLPRISRALPAFKSST